MKMLIHSDDVPNFPDIYEKIDLRTQSHDVPPQEILTKDSVTVFVNAIMYYRVLDSNRAVAAVDDYSTSTRSLAAATLRNILGTSVFLSVPQYSTTPTQPQ